MNAILFEIKLRKKVVLDPQIENNLREKTTPDNSSLLSNQNTNQFFM